jgi:hypothetical protein
VDDDLGVAAGGKGVAAEDELVPQLDVVEDLAVERNPQGAALVGQRLLPHGQVDDREPRVRESGTSVAIEPELVRAAVAQGARHDPELVEIGRRKIRAPIHHAGDAAHGLREHEDQ